MNAITTNQPPANGTRTWTGEPDASITCPLCGDPILPGHVCKSQTSRSFWRADLGLAALMIAGIAAISAVSDAHGQTATPTATATRPAPSVTYEPPTEVAPQAADHSFRVLFPIAFAGVLGAGAIGFIEWGGVSGTCACGAPLVQDIFGNWVCSMNCGG